MKDNAPAPIWSPACAARFAEGCPSRELFDQIVDNWSMMQDVVIIARTARAVLSSRGAY